jgi:hypothetical protein
MLWPLLSNLTRNLLRTVFSPNNGLEFAVLADEHGWPIMSADGWLYKG